MGAARFWPTSEPREVHPWDEPEHPTGGDCSVNHFHSGSGLETVKVIGVPRKLLLTSPGYGVSPSFHWGNWNPNIYPRDQWRGSTSPSRSASKSART